MSTTSTLIAPLLLLAGLAGTAPAAAAPVPPPALAEAQLRAINQRFVNSFVQAEPDFMARLADEDFLLLGADGAWHGRAAMLERTRAPSGLAGASYADLQVRLFGPVALLHGVFEGLGANGASRVRYTDVYVWNGSAWRLVSAQNTAVKAGVSTALQVAPAPASSAWRGRDPEGDEQAVLRTLNENYVKAFREADVSWYDAHLSPDYVVISGDGSMQDRGAALAAFARPVFATHMKAFPVDEVRIRRFGDVALIHAENDYELKDGRKGISRYTDIWLKQDGRWRCIAAHITVFKAPA